MLDLLLNNFLFALDGSKPDPQTTNQPPGMLLLFFYIAVIGGLSYLLLIRPNQRRERERKNMLGALKKNDHVVTIGGIKGVIVSLKPEENEVLLRVDEATGTKLRVTLSSIAGAVAPGEQDASGKKES